MSRALINMLFWISFTIGKNVIYGTDCYYTKFGDKLVPNFEVNNLKTHQLTTVEYCKVFCNENPNCHSFSFCDDSACHLNDKVLTKEEPTHHHPSCTTYYKPCGKNYHCNKSVWMNPMIFIIRLLLNARYILNLLFSAQIECDNACRCKSGFGLSGGKDLAASGMCNYWCSPIGAIKVDGHSYCGIGPSFVESNGVKGTDCRACHEERNGKHLNYGLNQPLISISIFEYC